MVLSFVSRLRNILTRSERKTEKEVRGRDWVKMLPLSLLETQSKEATVSPPTYQMHTRLLSLLSSSSTKLPRRQVFVTSLPSTNIAMATRDLTRGYLATSCSFLILGYSAMLTSHILELQETNACHGKRLLPDGIFWARYTKALFALQAMSKTANVLDWIRGDLLCYWL